MTTSHESMRPGVVRTLAVPLAVGGMAAAVVAVAAWHAVREDVELWTAAGFSVGPEMRFVLVCTVVAGLAGFAAARRLLRGPVLKREWTLIVPRIAPRPTDYREAPLPSVRDLVGRLETRGYQLVAFGVDPAGATHGPIDPRTALAGSAFVLRDARLGAGGVVVRLSELTSTSSGLGIVQAWEGRGESCEELALFVIAELGTLVPGLTYKAADSALSPDSAADLRGVLPDRPKALTG